VCACCLQQQQQHAAACVSAGAQQTRGAVGACIHTQHFWAPAHTRLQPEVWCGTSLLWQCLGRQGRCTLSGTCRLACDSWARGAAVLRACAVYECELGVCPHDDHVFVCCIAIAVCPPLCSCSFLHAMPCCAATVMLSHSLWLFVDTIGCAGLEACCSVKVQHDGAGVCTTH
jgi:hypothetical protein